MCRSFMIQVQTNACPWDRTAIRCHTIPTWGLIAAAMWRSCIYTLTTEGPVPTLLLNPWLGEIRGNRLGHVQSRQAQWPKFQESLGNGV